MGTYSRIIQVVGCGRLQCGLADPGDTVNVTIDLKNIGTTARQMWPGVTEYNGNIFYVYDLAGQMHVLLQPEETGSWFGHFTMPNDDVEIYVESWVEGDGGIWFTDDSISASVLLTPQYPASDIANLLFNPATNMESGGYYLGDIMQFGGTFEYKGKPQEGDLIISFGTGVAPLFFTAYTCPAIRLNFNGAYNWLQHELVSPNGSPLGVLIPDSLEVGQTYSVRATLKTDDGAQEIDTDFGVFAIKSHTPGFEDIAHLFSNLSVRIRKG